jgi:hypothetical protein
MATDRQKLVNAAQRLLYSRADAEDAVQWTESLHVDAGLTAESSSDSSLEVRSECEAAIRHLLRRVNAWEAAAILQCLTGDN